jgi:hypothetical protein
MLQAPSAHVPFAQVAAAFGKEQAIPHPPQCDAVVIRLKHVPPHGVCPVGHTEEHTPAMHVCPIAQRVPHAPQFSLSVMRFAQPVGHTEVPVEQPEKQATATGIERLRVVPSPSWPEVLVPQHRAPPPAIRAQV